MLGIGAGGPVGHDGLAAAGDGPPAADAALDAAERDAWVILATVERVGPVAFASLVRRFGSARAVLAAAAEPGEPQLRRPPPDPAPRGGRDPLADPALMAGLVRAGGAAAAILRSLDRAELIAIPLPDPAYPPRLRSIDLAPPVLFVRGDPRALAAPSPVAVVGTRRPTDAGRRLAAGIASSIAEAGGTIISGLAYGIDGAAHAATVEAGGTTVAVLGSGHDHLGPAVHRALARRIERAGGAIASEFAPDVRPDRHTFPRRNRIISGLADATVVVEAGSRSGALITAAWALEQGRECHLVPGPIGAASTAGSLRFLRDHPGLARVVAGIPELLEDLGLEADSSPIATADARGVAEALGPVERSIAAAIGAGPTDPDRLAATLGIPASTLFGAVTRLETLGLVTEAYGRYHPTPRLVGARKAFAPVAGPVLG
jgi:DNA processing protein